MEWNYLNKSIVDHAKVIYSRNIFFFLFLFSHQMITVENSQTFSSLKRELCQCTEHETWETFKWTWCVFLVPADWKLYSEFQNVQNKMFNFPYERVHHPPTVSIECPLVVTKNTSKISIKWKILAFKDKDRLWMYFFCSTDGSERNLCDILWFEFREVCKWMWCRVEFATSANYSLPFFFVRKDYVKMKAEVNSNRMRRRESISVQTSNSRVLKPDFNC